MEKQKHRYTLDELLGDEAKFREWAIRVIRSIKRRAKRK